MTRILNHVIMDNIPREALLLPFIMLVLIFTLRVWVIWLHERVGFHAGQRIRFEIRHQVLDRLQQAGPAWIQDKPAGGWAMLVLEQINDMYDYYARYLPQMALAVCTPLLIAAAMLPSNWVATLILLGTAPLIPLFITMVGMGAADVNRRNFQALARLSGRFLDRPRGMETLRIFGRSEAETGSIHATSQDFRQHAMEALRLAFPSPDVLEFFTSLSVVLVVVYFGFSYLGELGFGHYGTGVILTTGFLALILAPEFFQPLRDLGTFYYTKAQAADAVDSLKILMETPLAHPKRGDIELTTKNAVLIKTEDLVITSPEGKVLTNPLNFTLPAGQRAVLVSRNDSGRSSLLNVLPGFLSYQESLRTNDFEPHDLLPDCWRKQLSWVGQDPQLPAATLRDNVLLARPGTSEEQLQAALDSAWVSEFLPLPPQDVGTPVDDQAARPSVGQAQHVAVARALLNPCQLLLLGEPATSLDAHSEQRVMQALKATSRRQTTLMITRQLEDLADWDVIWVMQDGQIVEQGTYAELSAANGAFATLLAYRQKDI